MQIQNVCTSLRTNLTAVSPFNTANTVFIEGYDTDISTKVEASIKANGWAIVIEVPDFEDFSDSMVSDDEISLNAIVPVSLIIDETAGTHEGLQKCGQIINAVIVPGGDFVIHGPSPIEKPRIQTGLPVYLVNFECPVDL